MQVDEPLLVEMVRRRSSPRPYRRPPGQHESTSQSPPSDDGSPSRPTSTLLGPQIKELSEAAFPLEQMRRRTQVLPQPLDGHVGIRPIEQTVVAVDGGIEPSRQVVPLGLLRSAQPVPLNGPGDGGQGQVAVLANGPVGVLPHVTAHRLPPRRPDGGLEELLAATEAAAAVDVVVQEGEGLERVKDAQRLVPDDQEAQDHGQSVDGVGRPSTEEGTSQFGGFVVQVVQIARVVEDVPGYGGEVGRVDVDVSVVVELWWC